MILRSIAAVLLLSAGQADGFRTWTDATGTYQVQAVLLTFQDGTVRLRKADGTVVSLPEAGLSLSDRQYVRSVIEGVSAKPSAESRGGADHGAGRNATSPNQLVDERLFLLWCLEHLYEQWPTTFADRDQLIRQVADLRYQVNRHHEYVKAKGFDDDLEPLYAGLLGLVDAYAEMLTNIGAIQAGDVARAEKESVESGLGALLAGGGTFAAARDQGASSGKSLAAAGAVFLLKYLWDEYNKGREREQKRQEALEAAFRAWDNQRSSWYARAQITAEQLTEKFNWGKGEAGFDLTEAEQEKLADLIKSEDIEGFVSNLVDAAARRPRDPFASEILYRLALLSPVDNKQAIACAKGFALDCVSKVTFIPSGRFYDGYRVRFLALAGALANRAVFGELAGASLSEARNATAAWATDVWDACLSYAANDNDGAIRREKVFSLVCSGRLEEAAKLTDELLPLCRNDLSFFYLRACIFSCLGRADEAYTAFEYAVRRLGFSQIALARSDPELAKMREEKSVEFQELTSVKFKWTVDWGMFSDDIYLVNNSAFPITNVEFDVTIRSTGYPDWGPSRFKAERVGPGASFKWNTQIRPRGNDPSGTAILNCDQGP